MIMNSKLHSDTEPKFFSIHEIIRQHHFELVAWLRPRLSVPEDAQDIAQEAYLRMMKYESVGGINSPVALLHRIALNVAFDLERSNNSRHAKRHFDYADVELLSESPPVDQVLDAERAYDRVKAAIESLTPRCRQVFLLSRVKGLTYNEIAEQCEISVKMVEKHISHALLVCLQQSADL
jgi:RNA polymerase sigma factor (sigma-70 family)